MDSPAAAPQAPANAPSAFPLKPILWLLGSMTSLALGTSLAKQIFPIVGAQGTTALRLLFSALVLILFGRPWRHRMPRHDWWVVARYGMTLGMMNMLFYLALETIPFGIAVAIEFCGPLSVALFASRRPIDFVWIGCTVAGLLMLLPIWHGGGDAAAAQAVIEGAAGAVEEANRLRAADRKYFGYTGHKSSRQHDIVALAFRSGNDHDDFFHAGNVGRHGVHDDGTRISGFTARNINTDAVKRRNLLAQKRAVFVFVSP